ncbi:MAG: response regulator, partial [Chloroflexia bacterium]|nr:response regulator [Chloroflexia bacterium]
MHPVEEANGPSRILVIDSDPHILSQVLRILGRQKYEVLTATSAKAGLRVFIQDDPDLVLLELSLADADGLDLLVQMKERRRYCPIIVLSPPSAETAVAAMRRGADDYYSKPIVPEEMLDRVQHNLEKGRAARREFDLTENLQWQMSNLLSLREVAREASLAADLYHILQRAMDQTLQSLQLDAAIVFVKEGGALIPLAHRGLPRTIASSLTRRRLFWDDESLEPFHEVSEATVSRGDLEQGGPLSRSVGYGFTALVPLLAQGRLWGVLEVAGKESSVDLPRELDMLTSLGQQIALALANARLQETAGQHVRELALLNEACLALTSDLDLEKILTTIMLRTSDVIGVETGSLLMADEDRGELVFRIALGEVSG